jgi:hypothetical protein
MSDRWKTPFDFLLNLMRSHQDFTLPIMIQDGIPRDNQRDEKRKCVVGRKTIAIFYLIL